MNKPTLPSVTGLILAGGQARRMQGQDKGLLAYQQRPLIDWVFTALQPQVNQLLINANRHLAQYQTYAVPVISDELPNYQGPLAGMLAALNTLNTSHLLTCPCDSPFLPSCYRQRMMESLLASGADIAVATNGNQLQPVFCLLPASAQASLAAYLASGERKIETWLTHQRYVSVDFADFPDMFINLNRPEDLALRPMIHSAVPVLGFAAFSGTGKTTLLTQLIPLLTQRGHRIAVIKHAHHQFDIDKPGKDSYQLREAGAQQILIASSRMQALIEKNWGEEREPLLANLIQRLDNTHLDLILVEGFKHERFAKIELHRPALDKPLLYPDDPQMIAIATDASLPHSVSIPLLDLNDLTAIADFIDLFITQWNA